MAITGGEDAEDRRAVMKAMKIVSGDTATLPAITRARLKRFSAFLQQHRHRPARTELPARQQQGDDSRRDRAEDRPDHRTISADLARIASGSATARAAAGGR